MSTSAQQIPPLSTALERRFYPRIVPHAPLFLAISPSDACQEALLLNVSENGLLISTPADLACNFVARISIPLSTLPKPVQVTARVLWTSEDRKLAGIQLLDLTEHDRQRIRKWGAQESLQAGQLGSANPPLVARSSADAAEAAQQTLLLTPDAPPDGSLNVLKDSSPLLPSLVFRTQRGSIATRRIVIAMLVVIACLAAAFFLRSETLSKAFARLTENSSTPTAAATLTQDSQGSPEAAQTPIHNAVSRIPSLNPIESAANAKSDLTITPALRDSPLKIANFTDASSVYQKVSALPAQRHKMRTESTVPSEPSETSTRSSDSNPSHPPVANQAPARNDLSPATAVPPATGVASEKTPAVEKTDSSSDVSPEPLPSAPAPLSMSAALPAATRAVSTTNSSEASSSNFTSNPIAAPARAAISPTPGALIPRPAMQPIVRMDAPQRQVLDIRLPPGSPASFFLLPGHRILQSPTATLYLQRSVRMPAAHIGWPFNRTRKVIVGQLISRVDPQPAQFPPVPGSSVRVQATISEDGRIGNVRPILGQPNLLPAVVQAIREWRFQPTLVDNKPVKTQCYVVIQFHAPLYTSAKR